MIRRLSTIASVLSLLACVSVGVLWLVTLRWHDDLFVSDTYHDADGLPNDRWLFYVSVNRGLITLMHEPASGWRARAAAFAPLTRGGIRVEHHSQTGWPVRQAQGGSADLPDEEILRRLVALNAERADEGAASSAGSAPPSKTPPHRRRPRRLGPPPSERLGPRAWPNRPAPFAPPSDPAAAPPPPPTSPAPSPAP